MTYAVFLCDKQWKITIIQQCRRELGFQTGDFLPDLVSESLDGIDGEDTQYSMEMTVSKQKLKLSALIQSYKDGNLVVFVRINTNQEFLEFSREYPQYQEWAKDRLLGLFHNEYFLIQQINNQLVDAKRQLMRSNRKLEQALKENQEINQKLDAARILAEHASRSKTEFLANMSHDIRTPMNAIIGLTDLMQHNLDHPEKLAEYLKKLRSSSEYLLDLINDILDLSKIENGSLELKYEPMNLGTQIEQIVTIVRPQMTKKKLELSVTCGNFENTCVLGDPVRFRQVLMNVFSNAIKYTPEGGSIEFAIEETKSEEKQRDYEFRIKDSGIGMTQEFLEHIFDPFARAAESAKEIQGTGLGMAITKSIVDASGGSIHVSSAPGKGSCFAIRIPFEIVNEEPEQKPALLQDGMTEEMDLHGKKFLCAEDNELNAEILTAMLEMDGAECRIYRDGRQLVDAFEHVHPGQYDAILMDIQMPVMDGYEATRQIRNGRNPLGKEIPIIAMTANAFTEDIQACLRAGMDAHVSKPVNFDKLKEVLEHVCRPAFAAENIPGQKEEHIGEEI